MFWIPLLLAASLSFAAPPSSAPKRVVFLGDSLTEGYGVAKEDAFPARVEKLLHAKGHTGVQVINAGISGSTSASAVGRLKWHLKSKPDLVLLCLGGNDGLRGFPLTETRKNLQAVLDLARSNQIPVLLAGMKLPLNYGKEYREGFEKLYVDLAKQYKLPFIPFLLEGVGGDPTMNLEDGIHPNEKGHQAIAKTVLPYLEKLL
jgi:acyl-CoA thioesterase-1